MNEKQKAALISLLTNAECIKPHISTSYGAIKVYRIHLTDSYEYSIDLHGVVSKNGRTINV